MSSEQNYQVNPASVASQRTPWLVAGLVLAALGIALCLYSTFHHIQVHANGHTDAACNINATFSCDEVALSKYSEIAGVPLGIVGLGYFSALALMLVVALSGAKSAAEHLHGYVGMVIIGVLTSLTLGGISLGVLGTYCIVCIGIYLVTLLQAGLLIAGRRALIPPGFTAKSAGNGLMSAAIVAAVVVAGYNFLRPAHQPEHLDLPQTSGVAKTLPSAQLAPKSEDLPLTKSAYAGLGEDYRKGGDEATVVVQEFADFQCPACQHLSTDTEQLHREFGDKVLFVFRNYPLDNSCNSAITSKMHEFSCKAAIMARCAGQYGKFWQLYDLLYGNQREINTTRIKEWSKQVGLTDEQINTCWDSKDILTKVQDDIALGNRLGLDSTPTIYLNGRKVLSGHGLDDLRAAINDNLH